MGAEIIQSSMQVEKLSLGLLPDWSKACQSASRNSGSTQGQPDLQIYTDAKTQDFNLVSNIGHICDQL